MDRFECSYYTKMDNGQVECMFIRITAASAKGGLVYATAAETRMGHLSVMSTVVLVHWPLTP